MTNLIPKKIHLIRASRVQPFSSTIHDLSVDHVIGYCLMENQFSSRSSITMMQCHICMLCKFLC